MPLEESDDEFDENLDVYYDSDDSVQDKDYVPDTKKRKTKKFYKIFEVEGSISIKKILEDVEKRLKRKAQCIYLSMVCNFKFFLPKYNIRFTYLSFYSECNLTPLFLS